ncbi:MAG TPA: hypothetical protein VME40_01855 [Caulobacteraceae bacterium]|nr:hypothetical protein [Caulobacteraceae bacterium]
MVLIVTPLRLLSEQMAERRPSHLISLLGPENLIETPEGFDPERHLRLGVHDVSAPQPGFVAPSPEMVERILDFAHAWDASAPMMIHCMAGISRSTATAFVIACERNPHADEVEIALAMRRASHTAFPNRRIVAFADDLLGRQGRMLEAVEAMGGDGMAPEGVPFELAARH